MTPNYFAKALLICQVRRSMGGSTFSINLYRTHSALGKPGKLIVLVACLDGIIFKKKLILNLETEGFQQETY